MDACEAVDKELLRVITKFIGVHDHANRVLSDITTNFEDLQSSISERMKATIFYSNYVLYPCPSVDIVRLNAIAMFLF